MNEHEDDRTVPEYLLDILLLNPIRLLTSPFASRIYLRTALLTLTALALLALSIIAYFTFYYSYVPPLSFALPLHLQFSPTHARHPYAVAQIPRNALASGQLYDLAVHLCLPRTDENIDAGNFMIDVDVLSQREYKETVRTETDEGQITVDDYYVRSLAREARPALLSADNRLVDNVRRLLWLPALVAGWKSESECLDVPVMEGVSFAPGWTNLPESVRVEVIAQGLPERVKTLRVESAALYWAARFQGLRWILYKHSILSFMVFTAMFWAAAMTSTIVVWAVVSYTWEALMGSGTKSTLQARTVENTQGPPIKGEGEMSDTTRTFPTSSKQPALQYSLPDMKRESEPSPSLEMTKETEADDEDEEADFVHDEQAMTAGMRGDDSGIGTSLESSEAGRSTSVRRRKREG